MNAFRVVRDDVAGLVKELVRPPYEYDKKKYLAQVLPAKHLELMRGIKRTFDPAGILNPGKLFDPSPPT
jgi:FAD/FMN-containing dehydrogenase